MDKSAARSPLRYITRQPKAQEFEMFGMPKPTGDACKVVITVHETPASSTVLPTPPRAHLPKLKTSGLTPSQRPAVISNEVTRMDRARSTTPPSHLPPPPLPSLAAPAARLPMSSPSHARSNSAPSMDGQSPVMRSMFPRYNPRVALAKQHYYPSRESNSRIAEIRPGLGGSLSWSTSRYSTDENRGSKLSRPSARASTAAQSSDTDPLQSSHHSDPVPTLSTPEELLDLWSMANGQGGPEAATTYTLRLSCSDLAPNREVITFISSSSQILYMLDADDSKLTISRSHPINPTTTMQVSAPTITAPTSNDPLMATIFPKLAELMALDQSSSIAVSHRLNRQTNADLQAEALERAYQHEASKLFWDTDSQKFYLIHPTLSEGNNPCTFPIEFRSNQITIFSPPSHQAQAQAQAQTPIITLSLDSLVLTLNTNLITHLPSLYILDTLLTTILLLLLHIHRSSPSSTTSPLSKASPVPSPSFAPPPAQPSSPPPRISSPSPSSPSHQPPHRPSLSTKRRWPSSFFSLPRSQSSTLPTTTLSPKPPTSSPLNQPITATPFSALSPLKPLTITPTPKDEKDEEEEESLPRATRAALKLLYWAFSLVVWALGIAVRILAKGVVWLGKLGGKL